MIFMNTLGFIQLSGIIAVAIAIFICLKFKCFFKQNRKDCASAENSTEIKEHVFDDYQFTTRVDSDLNIITGLSNQNQI